MNEKHRFPIALLFPLLVLLLSSCAAPPIRPPADRLLAYTAIGTDRLAHDAPVLEIENPEKDYNRIGAPTISSSEENGPRITIDPNQPRIFAEKRTWHGTRGSYTNLIYRIHFREVPFSLIPFHLTAGSNVGLFIILTLNDSNQPVLVTTLHTCGCYLAFIPTSFLDRAAYPTDWDTKSQYVFGETLPGILQYSADPDLQKIHILLRDGVHRVMDLHLEKAGGDSPSEKRQTALMPLAALSSLQAADGTQFSFYETEGPRKDYVVGSRKFWERVLISWWAFDRHVGEDKRLGADSSDGPIFYTTLKPWDREASDLRNFADFLHYWGWNL